MHKWAEGRGFRIERAIYHGPQILWLQGGGLLARQDRIAILIVIRQPRLRDEAAEVTTAPPSRGLVTSPIATAGPLFVESPFECQVGDTIILEGGEKILVRP